MTFMVPGFDRNFSYGGVPSGYFGGGNFAPGDPQSGSSAIIGGPNSSPFPTFNSGFGNNGFGTGGFCGLNGMGGMEGLMQLMSTLVGMLQMMMGQFGGMGQGCPQGGSFGSPGGGFGGPGGGFEGPGSLGGFPRGGYGDDFGGPGFRDGFGGPRGGYDDFPRGGYNGGYDRYPGGSDDAIRRFPRGGRFGGPDSGFPGLEGPRGGHRPHGHNHDHGTERHDGPIDPNSGLARLPSGHLFNADGVEAFNRAQARAARDGVRIQVNSAYRSDQRQAELYQQLRGRQAVARPGSSTHNGSRGAVGIDIQNWRQARPYLEAEGFVWRNYANDPFHFDYTGPRTQTARGRQNQGGTQRASSQEPSSSRGGGHAHRHDSDEAPQARRISHEPESTTSSAGNTGSTGTTTESESRTSNDNDSTYI